MTEMNRRDAYKMIEDFLIAGRADTEVLDSFYFICERPTDIDLAAPDSAEDIDNEAD